MAQLVLPTACPNCLKTADAIVPLVRTVGVPFGGYVSTRAAWPFCSQCAELVTRHTRWKKKYAITPAVIVAFVGAAIAVFGSDRGIHPSAGWLLLAAVIISVFGTLFANIRHRFAAIPDDCLSNRPTVRPIRGGNAFLSRRVFGEYDFKHPAYVDLLLSLNNDENVKVNTTALELAHDYYRSHCRGLAAPDTVVTTQQFVASPPPGPEVQ